MTEIDDEIVRLSFDNSNFDSRVSESIDTLDKFRKTLDLKDTGKEAETNLARTAEATERLSEKFEKLHTVIGKVADDIKQKLANTIESTLKSFTIDNVMAGWTKYGEKTSSVATLVAQGYDIEQVEKVLSKLNWYTDETSYNFTDMVGNIAKFTAAGQGLEEASEAMQGIANWAALSGQNAVKASQAMYQISQAMGKGAFKLDDFKSIQNASMDTMEFRQHALDAAVALGTLRRNADSTYTVLNEEGKAVESMTFSLTGFTNYLSKGEWFTSDVMMRVFSEYGEAADVLGEMYEKNGRLASKNIAKINANNESAIAIIQNLTKAEDDAAIEQVKSWGKRYKVTDKMIDNLSKSTDFMSKVTDKEISLYMEEKDLSYDMAQSELLRAKAEEELFKKRNDAVYEYMQTFNVSQKQANKDLEKMSNYVDEFGIKAFKAAQECRTMKDALDAIADAAGTVWMNIFEQIFGNYEEAKVKWSALCEYIYDMFVQPLADVEEAFEKWRTDFSGNEILYNAFQKFGSGFKSISKMISKLFKAAFGTIDADSLFNVTSNLWDVADAFEYLTKKIKTSESFKRLTRLIRQISDGLGDVFGQVSSRVFDILDVLIDSIDKVASPILGIAGNIVKWVRESTDGFSIVDDILTAITWTIATLGNSISAVLNALKPIINGTLKNSIKIIGNLLTKIVKPVVSLISAILEKVSKFFGNDSVIKSITKFGKAIKSVFGAVWNIISKVIEGISNGFSRLFNGLSDNIDFNFVDIFTSILDFISERIERLSNFLNGHINFEKIPEGIGAAFTVVGGIIKSIGDTVAKIAPAIGETIGNFFGWFTKDKADDISSTGKELSIFEVIIGALGQTLDWFKGIFKSFSEFMGESWSNFQNSSLGKFFATLGMIVSDYIWPIMKNTAKLCGDILLELSQGKFDTVKSLLSNLSEIATYIMGIWTKLGLGSISKWMGKEVKMVAKVTKQAAKILSAVTSLIYDVGSGIRNVGKGAKRYLTGAAFSEFADGLKKLAEIIAIMAGLALVVALLPENIVDKMKEPIQAIVTILGLMMAAFLVFNKLASKNWKAIASTAGFVASLSLLFITIAGLCTLMAGLFALGARDKIFDAFGMFEALILTIGLVCVALTRSAIVKTSKDQNAVSKSFKGLGKVITGIAAAIAVITGAVLTFAQSDLNEHELELAAASFIGILGLMIIMLSGITMISSVQKENTKMPGLLFFGGMIAFIYFAIIPLLESLMKFANEYNNVGGQAIAALSIAALTTIAAIVGSVLAISKTAKASNELNIGKFITLGIVIGGLLFMISKVLIPAIKTVISDASGTSWSSAIGVAIGCALLVATLTATLLGSMYLLKDTYISSRTYIQVLVGMVAIILAISVLAKSLIDNSTDILSAIGVCTGIAMLTLAIGSAMLILQNFVDTKKLGNLAAGVVALGAILAALALFIKIGLDGQTGNGESIIALCAGLSILLVVMGGLVGIMGSLGPAVSGMLAFAGAIAIIAVSVSLLVAAIAELVNAINKLNGAGGTNAFSEPTEKLADALETSTSKTAKKRGVVVKKSGTGKLGTDEYVNGQNGADSYVEGFNTELNSVRVTGQIKSSGNEIVKKISKGATTGSGADNIEKMVDDVCKQMGYDVNGVDTSLLSSNLNNMFGEGITDTDVSTYLSSMFGSSFSSTEIPQTDLTAGVDNLLGGMSETVETDPNGTVGATANTISDKLSSMLDFSDGGSGFLGSFGLGALGSFDTSNGQSVITDIADKFSTSLKGALGLSFGNKSFWEWLLGEKYGSFFALPGALAEEETAEKNKNKAQFLSSIFKDNKSLSYSDIFPNGTAGMSISDIWKEVSDQLSNEFIAANGINLIPSALLQDWSTRDTYTNASTEQKESWIKELTEFLADDNATNAEMIAALSDSGITKNDIQKIISMLEQSVKGNSFAAWTRWLDLNTNDINEEKFAESLVRVLNNDQYIKNLNDYIKKSNLKGKTEDDYINAGGVSKDTRFDNSSYKASQAKKKYGLMSEEYYKAVGDNAFEKEVYDTVSNEIDSRLEEWLKSHGYNMLTMPYDKSSFSTSGQYISELKKKYSKIFTENAKNGYISDKDFKIWSQNLNLKDSIFGTGGLGDGTEIGAEAKENAKKTATKTITEWVHGFSDVFTNTTNGISSKVSEITSGVKKETLNVIRGLWDAATGSNEGLGNTAKELNYTMIFTADEGPVIDGIGRINTALSEGYIGKYLDTIYKFTNGGKTPTPSPSNTGETDSANFKDGIASAISEGLSGIKLEGGNLVINDEVAGKYVVNVTSTRNSKNQNMQPKATQIRVN